MLISAQVSSSYICQASAHSAKRAPHGRSHRGARDGRTGSGSCGRKGRHSPDTIVIELLLVVEERPPHERYKYGQKYTFSPNSCNAHSSQPLSQCNAGQTTPSKRHEKPYPLPYFRSRNHDALAALLSPLSHKQIATLAARYPPRREDEVVLVTASTSTGRHY